MRKQLDPRLPTLIQNCALTNQRSLIVLVGDKSRDQIVNLHFLLSQARVSSRPSVLWCYKKDLGFTTHRKKREAKVKRDVKRGIRDANEQNPFELFVTVTDIRYCYYKETQKVLGQTFGMLVLQDFEALTPNLWARTVETVQGGGMIVVLLKTMSSLRQLYTMTMDVHARYRTSASGAAVSRFNERFILSLGSCPTTLVLDDELNVLPLSSAKDITALDPSSIPSSSLEEQGLKEIQEGVEGTAGVADVVSLCKTVDQAKGLLAVLPHLQSHAMTHTLSLTSARGRGKSSLLGLSLALALHFGFTNIFVTSPHPSNLKSLFEFLFKGLDRLGWEEHLDYDIRVALPQPGEGESTGKDIVRVDLHRKARQTIQYIHPRDAHTLSQAELLIIDEAAAIPLPLVKALMGPYLVILSSTINGYEGTGRSLSLKLLAQLRENSKLATAETNGTSMGKGKGASGGSSRSLHEIVLESPIRYAASDPVEAYLSRLLLLTPPAPSLSTGTPHPSQCSLYGISRDTLFSFHPVAEKFLEKCWSLYVAAHYKNEPNDLMLLSDAPAQRLFVLCKEVSPTATTLPEPLCVVQVALEGRIQRESIMEGLRGGIRGGGDLIPWLIAQQYQDDGFGSLSGARVVRIATHPDYSSMGYGSRALELLRAFYGGEMLSLDEAETEEPMEEIDREKERIDPSTDLLTDRPTIRAINSLPPLLRKLASLKPEPLDYLGVSYGLTAPLLKFWKRAGYTPLYIRQTENELTGECTCVMLKTLRDEGKEWLSEFAQDYRKRLLSLLSFKFREFSSVMSLSVIEAIATGSALKDPRIQPLTVSELNAAISPFDIKRLESYANNMLDYHVILDLVPTIATLYFSLKLAGIGRLSGVQSSILLAVGLQRKSVEEIEVELGVPVNQILALFIKVIRRICAHFQALQKADIGATIPEEPVVPPKPANGKGTDWMPLEKPLDEELEEAGNEVNQRLKEEQRQMINSLDLSKYAINDNGRDWSSVVQQVSALASKGEAKRLSTVISVKSSADLIQKKRKAEEMDRAADSERKNGKKGGKKAKR